MKEFYTLNKIQKIIKIKKQKIPSEIMKNHLGRDKQRIDIDIKSKSHLSKS